jgi:hypothetical protein
LVDEILVLVSDGDCFGFISDAVGTNEGCIDARLGNSFGVMIDGCSPM